MTGEAVEAADILDAIYAASLGERPFDGVLGRIAARFGADAGALVVADAGCRGLLLAVAIEPEGSCQAVPAGPSPADLARAGARCDGAAGTARSQDAGSPALARWAEARGLSAVAAAGFERDGRFGTLVFGFREARSGDVDACRRFVDLLVPHVSRALAISGVLSGVRARQAAAETLFDALSAPFLILDPRARVLQVNRAARRLFARTNVLWTEDGRLAAAGALDRALAEAIARATAPTGPRRATSVALSAAGETPTVARVLPLSVAIPGRDHDGRHAALIIQGAGDERLVPYDAIAALHGLTQAESQVLELVAGGRSPAETADHLGIAVSTVRTHLQHLFGKTGARGQSDLVRLVRRYAAP